MNRTTNRPPSFQEQAQQALSNYALAYQQMYRKTPRDLKMLGSGWVSVNGVRMRVNELDFLTRQLTAEYTQDLEARRNVVHRLIDWFTRH